MPLTLADRLDQLGTETAYTVSQEAAAMQASNPNVRVFPMHIGDLNFQPEPALVKALNDAIADCRTGYCAQQGILPLRQAIATRVGKDRGIPYTADNVSVQPGGKFVIAKFLSSVMNPKDEVLFPSPGYPIYHSQILFLGGIPVPYGFKPHPTVPGGLVLDIDSVRSRITPRTKVICINDFHNPTGYVLLPEEREALARIAVENDLWVLADEAYWDLVWDAPERGHIPPAISPDTPAEEVEAAVAAAAASATDLNVEIFTKTARSEPDTAPTSFDEQSRHRVSMAALPGMQHRTCILLTCSKSWAMTGWRCGAAIGPKSVIDSIHRLNVNYEGCTTQFVQYAAIPCFNDPDGAATDYLRTLRSALLERRDALVPLVQQVPGMYTVPAGSTFYCYVEASTAFEIIGCMRYEAFRRRLLADTGVSFTTREHFGQSLPLEGCKHIRFAYSGIGVPVIETAMRTLAAYIRASVDFVCYFRLQARPVSHRVVSFVAYDDHLFGANPRVASVIYDAFTFGEVVAKAPGPVSDAFTATWTAAVEAAAAAAQPTTSRPITPRPDVVSVVDLSEAPKDGAAAAVSAVPTIGEAPHERDSVMAAAHQVGARRAAALIRDAQSLVVGDAQVLPRVVFTAAATPQLRRVVVVGSTPSAVATGHALGADAAAELAARGVAVVYASEASLPAAFEE